jgi:hypothetical protein
MSAFAIAGGAVIGRDHARAGKNGQDALAWAERDGTLAAVVTDGCSSAPHSEVGAKLGARILVDGLLRGGSWQEINAAVLARLRAAAEAMGGVDERTVHDYFLFAAVGVVVRPDLTTIVAAGDGLAAVNGARVQIGPYPDNAPPYLGYALLGDAPGCLLRPLVEIPTAELGSALVATDGAAELELAEFWRDARFFANSDQVRRRLTLLGRERGLADDTAVVVLRRRP